jgi:hypothetical protein
MAMANFVSVATRIQQPSGCNNCSGEMSAQGHIRLLSKNEPAEIIVRCGDPLLCSPEIPSIAYLPMTYFFTAKTESSTYDSARKNKQNKRKKAHENEEKSIVIMTLPIPLRVATRH